jgi:hypothetical protein
LMILSQATFAELLSNVSVQIFTSPAVAGLAAIAADIASADSVAETSFRIVMNASLMRSSPLRAINQSRNHPSITFFDFENNVRQFGDYLSDICSWWRKVMLQVRGHLHI